MEHKRPLSRIDLAHRSRNKAVSMMNLRCEFVIAGFQNEMIAWGNPPEKMTKIA